MATQLFDVDQYRAASPDLASAGIVSDQQLFSHFISYGLREGRRFSSLVDLSEYSALNPDLSAAGLNSRQQLYDHLSGSGIQEGRTFSTLVDLDLYLTLNSDVRQAVGGSYQGAFEHLQRFGLGEGRQFSLQFYAEDYDALNPGLAIAGVNTPSQQWNHFLDYGIDEGRAASQVFRLQDYRRENADLAGLSNQQLLQHFRVYGAAEGRVSSDRFNVRSYLDRNADLSAAGLNFRGALQHYLQYGRQEGRPALPLLFAELPIISGQGSSVVDNVRYNWEIQQLPNARNQLAQPSSQLRLDPSRSTILVAHGRVFNANDATTNIEALAETAAAQFPEAQVLFLDWRNASADSELRPDDAGQRVGTVANDVAQALRNFGFENGSRLNFYGHSLGALLMAKVAENYGSVNGLVALDPAFPAENYDLDNDGDTSEDELPDLRQLATHAVAFVVEDNLANGIAGDNDYAMTAARGYVVDFSGSGGSSLSQSSSKAHNAVVNIFSSLLTLGLTPESLATDPRILPDQWRQSGRQSSDGAEGDGVIEATFLDGAANLRVDELAFVEAGSGQRGTIAIDQTISLQFA